MDRHALDKEPSSTSRSRVVLAGLLLLLVAVFVGLGTWQIQRLFWKLDLIARVEARIHRETVAAPPALEWGHVSAETDEYRRISAIGTFRHDKAVLVQAVTERGPGFWVVAPLVQDGGSTILINRGFVPAERRDPMSRARGDIPGPVKITGLLRISEPGGAFLRSNDPAKGRWYSRDVGAIATAQGLANVAPYFIDADATPNPGGLPIGGLTVVSFRNSHLIYAMTWFVLALMSAVGGYIVGRRRVADAVS